MVYPVARAHRAFNAALEKSGSEITVPRHSYIFFYRLVRPEGAGGVLRSRCREHARVEGKCVVIPRDLAIKLARAKMR